MGFSLSLCLLFGCLFFVFRVFFAFSFVCVLWSPEWSQTLIYLITTPDPPCLYILDVDVECRGREMFLELCYIQSLHGINLPDHGSLSEHGNYGAEIHGRVAGERGTEVFRVSVSTAATGWRSTGGWQERQDTEVLQKRQLLS